MKRSLMAVAAALCLASPTWAGPGDLFSEKVMDFGVSAKGTVLVHYFRFTNTTKDTLTLGTPRVSCGCTSASLSSYRVAPGESAAVIAYMDTRRIQTPNAPKSVVVYVPFYSPLQEEVVLRVQTVARDDLMMSPDTLAFGTINKGQGGKVSTKVTFLSDPNWKVTEATSTGGYVKVGVKEDTRSGNFVTYEITAELDKACPAGNWVSDINLKSSNPAVGKLRIPVSVNVFAALDARPDNVAFGKVALGSNAEKTITIQSGKPFKILEVKGVDEQLKVVLDRPEASQVHTIVLAANPKSMGGFARSVEFITDSKEQPKIIIPVTAQVVAK